ncbi:MAG: RidA family protein [Planctomycetes bacterium]|nr:RidA family protein [Planctomycetota bacterium]
MTARIEPVNVPGWPRPSGYNNGIAVTGAEKILYIAGQVGWNEKQQIVSDDFVLQFKKALENVATVARAGGAEPSAIVRLVIYVTNKNEYSSRLADIGKVYRDVMGKTYPAMTLVQVADLLEKGAKVEIEAIAAD